MSGQDVAAVRNSGLPRHLKRTAEVCALLAREGGTFAVSVEKIAERAELSERMVQYHLRALLEEWHVLEIQTPAVQRYPAVYRFVARQLPPRGAIVAPLGRSSRRAKAEKSDPRGATIAPLLGVQSLHPIVRTDDPEILNTPYVHTNQDLGSTPPAGARAGILDPVNPP